MLIFAVMDKRFPGILGYVRKNESGRWSFASEFPVCEGLRVALRVAKTLMEVSEDPEIRAEAFRLEILADSKWEGSFTMRALATEACIIRWRDIERAWQEAGHC